MNQKKYTLESLAGFVKKKGLDVHSEMIRILGFFTNHYLTHYVPINHDGPAFNRARHVSDFTGVSYETTKSIMRSLEERRILGETVKTSRRGSEHKYGVTLVARRYL